MVNGGRWTKTRVAPESQPNPRFLYVPAGPLARTIRERRAPRPVVHTAAAESRTTPSGQHLRLAVAFRAQAGCGSSGRDDEWPVSSECFASASRIRLLRRRCSFGPARRSPRSAPNSNGMLNRGRRDVRSSSTLEMSWIDRSHAVISLTISLNRDDAAVAVIERATRSVAAGHDGETGRPQ